MPANACGSRDGKILKALRRARRARRSAVIEKLEARRLLSVNVLNYHNDNASTGVNANEDELTPTNVKVGSFGKLSVTTLDGQAYAQPLIDTSVTINAGVNNPSVVPGVYNVAFVATENDSLYAINAGPGGGQILWQRAFASTSNSGGDDNNPLNATSVIAVPAPDTLSSDITPSVGITGTPVIDSARNLLYVVVATRELVGGQNDWVQRLHAINLSDGTDAVAPFLIGLTNNTVLSNQSPNANTTPIYVYGTGDGAVTDPYNNTGKSVVQFNALRQNQRAALSLVNNTVYVSWASQGDNGPYHGWVCAWNVSNVTTTGFVLSGVLCTSPNDGESGVWMGGGQLVFEPDDSAFYFTTGNGSGPDPSEPTLGANGLPTDANYNEAVVKVVADPTSTPSNQNPNGWGMKIVDFFIPYNVTALDGADSDFGSGAPVLLPPSMGIPGHPNLMVLSGKDGRIYLVDRDNLGHYSPLGDAVINAVPNSSGIETPPTAITGQLNTAAVFNGKIYVLPGYGGSAVSFTIAPGPNDTASLVPTSTSSVNNFGYLPGSPSISANGTSNGIVWVEDRNANTLRAYDARTFATELWDSNQAPGDGIGALNKFNVPTIANGEVYVTSASTLVIYGLTPAASKVPAAPVLTATTVSASSINLTWTDPSIAPNIASGYLIDELVDNTLTPLTTAAAGATSLAIGGLDAQTPYAFEIAGFNGVGDSNWSTSATATTSTGTTAQAIDFPTGFSSAASQITLNGAAALNGSALELTSGVADQTSSAFDKTAVTVASFSTQFAFQLAPGSEGFTFTLQNQGTSAIGQGSESLGYGSPTATGGIASSVAIKFDVFSDAGEGADSTGFYANGADPTTVGSNDLTSTGVTLDNGDVFLASMTYDGSTLAVTITDESTNASATQDYSVNIPTLIGSSTAFAGFTASTGGSQPIAQNILSWVFGPNVTTSPNAPSGLGASPASATSVTLNWTNTAANQSGFLLDRATDQAFTQNLITESLPSTPDVFTDTATGLAPGNTYYYRIRATNAAGPSGYSNVASAYIPDAPPKPTLQQITNVSPTEIDMQWQDNAGHLAEGYEILRAANNGPFSVVATLPPTSRTAPSEYAWSDTNLTPGTFYEYHIQAYNVSGNNDFAGVNATTLTNPPVATAIPGNGLVTLTWPAITGATSYNIYRSLTPGGEGTTPYATGITAATFGDSSVTNGTTYYYTVTAVNPNVSPLPSESAPSAEVNATPALTANGVLVDSDIGGPGLAGSASFASGVYTVAGGGDINGIADQFNFDSAPVAGNASLIVQVDSQTATDPSAKAGLMFRDSTAANAAEFAIVATPANGIELQWRTADGGSTSLTDVLAGAAVVPSWLQIVRLGNAFTAYYSTQNITNPAAVAWTQFGPTETITMANARAGLAVSSHNNASLSTATFSNLLLSSSAGAPLSDADVGGPSRPGSGSFNNGIYTLTGSGSDIYAKYDQFNFDSLSIAGNATMIVQVDSQIAPDFWSKAGLMFRDSTSPAAANFAIVATGSEGVSVQYRPADGASTSFVNVLSGTTVVPDWLEITRVGNVFTAYYSEQTTTNPAAVTWTQFGPIETISMPATALAGLAVTSHTTAYVSTATFGNFSLSGTATTTTTTIPSAPATLTAAASTGQVALSWAASTGATTYDIFRGTTPGGEGTTPYLTASTTTDTDTAVTNGTTYYYTVKAVNAAGTSSTSPEATATPTATTSSGGGGALSDADIGPVGKPGSASYSNAIYTVTGSGTDIYGTADQFNFDSTAITGNATLITQVDSQTNTDPWAKAGLMFRDSAAANGAEFAVVATPGNGVELQWRTTDGGTTTYTNLLGGKTIIPLWLKIVRTGNVFTAFYSTQNTASPTWTPIGTAQTIAMPTTALAGLAVTAHNNASLSTATFSNFSA